MKSIEIKGTKRTTLNKQEVKALRNEEKVPCVLYGGKEQLHFSADASEFKPLIYTPAVHTVSIDVDGSNYQAIVQDVQYHPINDRIMHVDFLAITDDKPVIIDVPVKLTGTSEGVRAGGKLLAKVRKLKISALRKALPDFIEISISNLQIGDSVRVRDLQRKDITFLDSPNNVVVGVRVTRAVVEEVPVAAAATIAAATPAPAAAEVPAKAAAPSKGGKEK